VGNGRILWVDSVLKILHSNERINLMEFSLGAQSTTERKAE